MPATSKVENLTEIQKSDIEEWYMKGRTIVQLVHRIGARYTVISQYLKSKNMKRTSRDCAKLSGWQNLRLVKGSLSD